MCDIASRKLAKGLLAAFHSLLISSALAVCTPCRASQQVAAGDRGSCTLPRLACRPRSLLDCSPWGTSICSEGPCRCSYVGLWSSGCSACRHLPRCGSRRCSSRCSSLAHRRRHHSQAPHLPPRRRLPSPSLQAMLAATLATRFFACPLQPACAVQHWCCPVCV